MFCQYTAGTLARSIGYAVRISLLVFVLAPAIGAVPRFSANAAIAPQVVLAGNGHNGNGRHNKNSITINSPTISRGIQHNSNGNAGGIYNAQRAFCKAKFRHCTIVQKIISGR